MMLDTQRHKDQGLERAVPLKKKSKTRKHPKSSKKRLSVYSLLSYRFQEKESWSLLSTSQRNEQMLLQELVTPRPLEAPKPQACPSHESHGRSRENPFTLMFLLSQQPSIVKMPFCTKSFCMDDQHSIQST